MEDAVMAAMRIDRFLAECGTGSRSEVKQLLKKGLVAVNGVIAKKPELKVDPVSDCVTVSGKQLCFEPYEYVMLHKPAGCITAARDARQKTVMEYLGAENRADPAREPEEACFHKTDLAPVGRLDLDTEGLLLFTNDGELAHRMLAPKSHVNKTYFAKVQGCVNEEDVKAFAEGLEIGEKQLTLPAKLELFGEDTCSAEERYAVGSYNKTAGEGVTYCPPEERHALGSPNIPAEYISEVELTIQEGKFHQVKRMFESRGKKVLYLKRISMGGVELDRSLRPGQWRYLTEEEIRQLYISCGLPWKG